MKKSMKKVLATILTLSMIGGIFTGCGSKEDEVGKKEAGKGGDSSKEVVLTMTGWYPEETMQPIFDAMEPLYPENIKLEYTYMDLSQYNSVISTQLASGEGPDIITGGGDFPARIQAGNLVEITDKEYLKNFNEAGFSLASTDGKIYGVPSYGWFGGIWYNKNIFQKYNLSQPKTFDEFIKVCDTLKENGVEPLAMGLADGNVSLLSYLGYVEATFSHTPEGLSFDNDFAMGKASMSETMKPYINKWYNLIDKGHINEKMLGMSMDQAQAEFANENAAMFYGGPWNYEYFFKENPNLKLGMFPFVGEKEGSNYLVGGPAACYGVNVNSEHQEEAQAVLAAMASKEAQEATLKVNPGAFGYYEGLNVEIPEEYDEVRDVLTAGDVACAWDRWSINMPSQTMSDEILKQLQTLINKTATPEEVLQEIDNLAKNIRYVK